MCQARPAGRFFYQYANGDLGLSKTSTTIGMILEKHEAHAESVSTGPKFVMSNRIQDVTHKAQ